MHTGNGPLSYFCYSEKQIIDIMLHSLSVFWMWLNAILNIVNNKEMLVVPRIWVHDGAVCLVVSGLWHTCTSSRRSCGLCVAAIWNHIGKSIVHPLLFFMWLLSALVLFLFFCFPPTTPHFFFSLSTVIPVWRVPRCLCVGVIAGLQGLLAMGAFYRLGAG